MAKSEAARESVLILGVRLSFPALAEPKQVLGMGDPKYQASFIFPRNSQAHTAIQQAVQRVAAAAFGKDAPRILAGSDSQPLRDGDLKGDTAGYAGMLYVNTKSLKQPQLIDADKTRIFDPEVIKQKFQPGYYVNAQVSVYSYSMQVKRGIAVGLDAVQFARIGEPLGGTVVNLSAFPDESAGAAAASASAFGSMVQPAAGVPLDDGIDYPF